jgi:hypothetical protein
MADGQLAVNTEATSPGLFFKNASGNLVKVGPVHVGTTAPNASPASGGEAGNTLGEQWLDTTGGTYVFKVWDGSAWRSETGTFVDVNGDTMTGALGIITGSASTPGLFVSGDTNTGIYSPGADQLGVATGGTARVIFGATGIATFSGGVVVDTTGAITIPDGTTAQRPGTPATGDIRFNTSLIQFEGYNGTAWGTIGGGAVGGGSDRTFYENDQTVTTNYTLTTNKNAMTAGPVTINSGVTVTVPSGSNWVVV